MSEKAIPVPECFGEYGIIDAKMCVDECQKETRRECWRAAFLYEQRRQSEALIGRFSAEAHMPNCNCGECFQRRYGHLG